VSALPGSAPLALVVGLGSPDRGDDGVGPAVAKAMEQLHLPGVRVATHEDPTALVHLWADAKLAVVIDAVASDSPPGTMVRLEVGREGVVLPESTWHATGRGGTHAFGLAAAVELSRVLHRLPERVVVIGVEAEGFEHGTPLSDKVSAAVPRVVQEVREILASVLTGGNTA